MMAGVMLIIALYSCTVFFATILFVLIDMNTSAEKAFAMALIWPICLLYVVIASVFLFIGETLGFVGRGFKEIYQEEANKWRGD